MKTPKEESIGMTPTAIARICHAANAEYCRTIGDESHVPWENLSREMREGVINGVVIAAQGTTLRVQHETWLQEKVANGWKYGPTKDVSKKLHPNIKPFDQLPIEERRKDALFVSIVQACRFEFTPIEPLSVGTDVVNDEHDARILAFQTAIDIVNKVLTRGPDDLSSETEEQCRELICDQIRAAALGEPVPDHHVTPAAATTTED